MIRYSSITIFLLLSAFIIQQFLPAFTELYHSRILLVQLVFLCTAVTVGQPTMLLLAFIGGFFWDAHSVLSSYPDDPEVYTRPVESLRFGYSIFLFAAFGFLMQGIQPLFKQGKWHFSALLSGISIFLYLAIEYLTITFVRGEFHISLGTIYQMGCTSLLTMIFSPLVFWLLFHIANLCNHSINPEVEKKRRFQY